MAVEGLVLTPPSGSSIDLNGSKWGLEALNIGQPGRREDLLSSLDADGGLPARVSPRDVREVTATIRLLDAANMNAAMNSIGDLEKMLESAERLAASNPTNPVTDLVRLVYTPAGSTYSYSLIVLAAEIAEIPREMSGDGLGFFIARPVVSIRAICDPFAYGTTGSTPFTTTYLDTTTTAAAAVSATVAGGVGDVSPWLRLKIKDVDSKARYRVIAGVKTGEGSTTATIGAASMTAIAGTISSGTVTTSSTDWVVSASIPRQTRTGSFRAYLVEARSNSTGSVRLTTAEAGGSKRTGPTVAVSSTGYLDAYLGEVVVDSSWDGWIETTGSVLYASLVLIPTDSFVEVLGPLSGPQMVGSVAVADTLSTTSSELLSRSVTTGSGTWSAPSGWPVSSTNWARRTASSMASPAIAYITGTGSDFINVALKFQTRTNRAFDTTTIDTTNVNTGAVLRYNTTSGNYLVAGWRSVASTAWAEPTARPIVAKVISGTFYYLWVGDPVSRAYDIQVNPGSAEDFQWEMQVTDGGFWSLRLTGLGNTNLNRIWEANGQDTDLTAGGVLGNTSNAKIGLYDFWPEPTPTLTRDIKNFQASNFVGVTPPPIQSGGTLTLSGPKMTNADGAEYPYLGSSGVKIRPGVNNNLTVMTRPSVGLLTSATSTTPPLDLDIEGYPRFISVPHT